MSHQSHSSRAHDDEEDDDSASLVPSSPDPSNNEVVPNKSNYGQFTWTVALPQAPADKESLSDISKIRQFSDVFEVGGFEWKLEMYPYGDSQSDKTLSVFLCAVDRKQLPGWSQTAHYQIAVINKDASKTSTHTGYDIFRGKRDSAWGWSKLINLSKLHDLSQGWADDDGKITLQATVYVVTHEYMPVNRTYRKSLCGLYYERALQSYFEPFLKDELQRLDKLCGNSVLHKGFSDFWAALPDGKRRNLLQITMDEVLLNVKARLFSRDQPATYLAADVIFKAAHDCSDAQQLPEGAQRSLVGCTSIAVVDGGDGAVLRLERLEGEAKDAKGKTTPAEQLSKQDNLDSAAGSKSSASRVMLRTHKGVMRMSNAANFVDVFRAQVADALDNVHALVKHLKPQSCDGSCMEAMGRQMLAVFAMCGMYITNVHPAYHEKLALQLQEDLIREEEEKSQKAEAKKAKQAEKRKRQAELKAQKKAEEEEAKKRAEEEEKRQKEQEAAKRKQQEEEQAKKKAEARRKAQEEAERQRKLELEAEEKRKREEAERRAAEEEAAKQAAAIEEKEEIADEEKAKRQQIAQIMRDTSLTPVDKQSRVQAILAGKVEVPPGQSQWSVGMAAAAATAAAAVEPPVDVEAFALGSSTLAGIGEQEDDSGLDDVMAMATGMLDPSASVDQSFSMPYGAFGASTGFAGNAGFGAAGAYGSSNGFGMAAPMGGSTSGSRLFERWSAAPLSSNNNHNGVLVGHNGSDSEENNTEASLASTASGTRTPLSLDVEGGEPGSPEVFHTENMATSCALSALDAAGSEAGHVRRRQLSILVGYLGADHKGLVRSVENEILKALRTTGAVAADPVNGAPEKIGWSCAVTQDAGVHAAGQCITFDALPPRGGFGGLVERLNSKLPQDIRILNCAPCGADGHHSSVAGARPANSKRFDPYHDAILRAYDYVIPSAALFPIPKKVLDGGLPAMLEHMNSFRFTKKQENSFNQVMKLFQNSEPVTGKNALDFSIFLEADPGLPDPRSRGPATLKSCRTGEKVVINGVEHVALRIEGSCLSTHQLRRVVGLTVKVAQGRGSRPAEEILHGVIHGGDGPRVPVALPHHLLLDRVFYGPGDKGMVLPKEGWTDAYSVQQMEGFKRSVLYPNIGSPAYVQGIASWIAACC